MWIYIYKKFAIYAHILLDVYKHIKIFSVPFWQKLILAIVLKFNFLHFQIHSCLILETLSGNSIHSGKIVGKKWAASLDTKLLDRKYDNFLIKEWNIESLKNIFPLVQSEKSIYWE